MIKRDIILLSTSIAGGIVVGVGVFYISGNAVPTTSAVAYTQPSVAVPFTEIKSGTQSKVTTRVNYLITSSDELKSLWKMIDAKTPPPTLDFNKQALLAVFAGKQLVAGSDIVVSKIEDATARLVSITIARPTGACAKKKVTTTPYQLVAVPTTTLPLAHKDVITTTGCP